MQQTSHGVVHEEGSVRDLALPFAFRRDVLVVSYNTFPLRSWHDLIELFSDESTSLIP